MEEHRPENLIDAVECIFVVELGRNAGSFEISPPGEAVPAERVAGALRLCREFDAEGFALPQIPGEQRDAELVGPGEVGGVHGASAELAQKEIARLRVEFLADEAGATSPAVRSSSSSGAASSARR
jgi:hypothetical protein